MLLICERVGGQGVIPSLLYPSSCALVHELHSCYEGHLCSHGNAINHKSQRVLKMLTDKINLFLKGILETENPHLKSEYYLCVDHRHFLEITLGL